MDSPRFRKQDLDYARSLGADRGILGEQWSQARATERSNRSIRNLTGEDPGPNVLMKLAAESGPDTPPTAEQFNRWHRSS